MAPLAPTTVKLWLYRLLRMWCGDEMWHDIRTNQRKMEAIFKLWKTQFFGFGLQKLPGRKIMDHFRVQARAVIAEQTARANEARRKSVERMEGEEPADYYNMESAKLWNIHTTRKTLLPYSPEKENYSYNAPKPRARRISNNLDQNPRALKFTKCEKSTSVKQPPAAPRNLKITASKKLPPPSKIAYKDISDVEFLYSLEPGDLSLPTPQSSSDEESEEGRNDV